MKPITSLLTHTFTIYRPVRIANGQGGHTEVPDAIGTALGRLRPAGASERVNAAQQQSAVSHILYMGGDEDIERGDTVEGAGVQLRVLDVRQPSYAGHHLEIDCIAIQKEPA